MSIRVSSHCSVVNFITRAVGTFLTTHSTEDVVYVPRSQRRRQNLRPRGNAGQILGGHQDMVSTRAQAYNGGRGGAPSGVHEQSLWSEVLGALQPEAVSPFAFGRLIMQYFAVFIRFSADNCMTLPEIEITW